MGERSASTWLFKTPTALRKTLVWLDKRYSVDGRKVEFTISENGVSGPGEAVTRPPEVLNDRFRLSYYRWVLKGGCYELWVVSGVMWYICILYLNNFRLSFYRWVLKGGCSDLWMGVQ